MVPSRQKAPKFTFRTQLLTLIVVLSNVVGNISLSEGMHQVGRISSVSMLDYLHALANVWVIVGICVLAIWMASELALLSLADLSFVLPVTASSNVLIALAGHFLLGDHISWERWLGISVITLGVVLAEETPPRTTGELTENLE